MVLAGEAVIDAWPAGVTPASKAKVITALVESFPNAAMPAEWRGRAGRALANLGDPRQGVSLDTRRLPDLLWVRIPGTTTVRESGRFPNFTGLRLGTGAKPDPEADEDEKWPRNAKPLDIADFELAAYPLTVAQFKPFVEQGGYRENRYWSKTGWRWREEESREVPNYWDDSVWNVPNYPIVGMTWYEAEAYCNWLNEQLQLAPGMIRLPTEAEWEWAARGPEGRRYPWGDTWEAWRCNSGESDLDRTSAVGCFPGGAASWWLAIQPDSQVVYDLAGNVWEWTASEYSKDYSKAHQSVLNTDHSFDRPCVLRGGSWHGGPWRVRGAARYRFHPHARSPGRGFRLARTFP